MPIKLGNYYTFTLHKNIMKQNQSKNKIKYITEMFDFNYDHLLILTQSDIQLNYTPTTERENN